MSRVEFCSRLLRSGILLLQIWCKERKRGKRPQPWAQKHTLASPPQLEEQSAVGRRRRPPPVLKVNQIAWTSDNTRVCSKGVLSLHRSPNQTMKHRRQGCSV